MKTNTVLFLSLGTLISTAAMAAQPYFVDSMYCRGQRAEYTDARASESMYEATKYTSIQTKKKDGSLAQTLKSNNDEEATPIDPKALNDNDQYPEYSGNLYYDAPTYDAATQKFTYHITDGVSLHLSVTSSAVKGKTRVDQLEGYEGDKDLTKDYGLGYYNVTCEANVVSAATQFIDATNQCRTLSMTDIVQLQASKGLTCSAKSRQDPKNSANFLVFARCADNKGYSFTVPATPAASGARGCTLGTPVQTRVVNINKSVK